MLLHLLSTNTISNASVACSPDSCARNCLLVNEDRKEHAISKSQLLWLLRVAFAISWVSDPTIRLQLTETDRYLWTTSQPTSQALF